MSNRSYKQFDEMYKRDITFAPFHVGYIFDDFDYTFWFNQTPLSTNLVCLLRGKAVLTSFL